jgi:poly(3-hydroxybutyrate) depolymerase
MRKISAGLIVLLTLLLCSVGSARSSSAATPLVGQHVTLASGRTYWLTGTGSILVIGFPGSNLSAQNVNDTFWQTGNPATAGWQKHSMEHGYVLALAEPVGGGSWNVGNGWPSGSQNDESYALDIVDSASTLRNSFTAVYTAGFSAGGAMAWKLVADRPDIFKACFSSSGWAPYYPTHPIDCYHVHGTSDATVPIRGGTVIMFPYTFPAALDEALMSPRESLLVLEPLSGAHSTPGWAAQRALDFFNAITTHA